jgi:peptidoglycan-associated lipoprotein
MQMRLRWIWLVSMLWLAVPSLAQSAGKELALTYAWMRGNAPVGGCGCFALNGGGASLAWPLNPRIALAAEVGATRASSQDLTLATYLAGPRLRLLSQERESRGRLAPFAQLLLGGSHASGALAGTAGHSSNAFALRAGGGLDVPLNGALTLRPIEADYLFTRFPNQVNDRQNIVQLDAGLVIRFGGSRNRSSR